MRLFFITDVQNRRVSTELKSVQNRVRTLLVLRPSICCTFLIIHTIQKTNAMPEKGQKALGVASKKSQLQMEPQRKKWLAKCKSRIYFPTTISRTVEEGKSI